MTTDEGLESESQPKQGAESAGDGILGEVLSGVVEGAVNISAQAVSGAADAAACAGEIAVKCGEVAMDAACTVAGSMLDGV